MSNQIKNSFLYLPLYLTKEHARAPAEKRKEKRRNRQIGPVAPVEGSKLAGKNWSPELTAFFLPPCTSRARQLGHPPPAARPTPSCPGPGPLPGDHTRYTRPAAPSLSFMLCKTEHPNPNLSYLAICIRIWSDQKSLTSFLIVCTFVHPCP